MRRYVAFLRGMNLGRRRITNDDLCDAFRTLGFDNVSAFLASGNVILDTSMRSVAKLTSHIETGLRDALGYEVPTFVRSAADVEAIAAMDPFGATVTTDGGKLQVALLRSTPTEASRRVAHRVATKQDQLAVDDQQMYWLPAGKIT